MRGHNSMLSAHRSKMRVSLSHPLRAFEFNGDFFTRSMNLARAWQWMVQGSSALFLDAGSVTMFAPWVDLADSDPAGLDSLDTKATAGNVLLWLLLKSSILLSDGLLVVSKPDGSLSEGQEREIEFAKEARLIIFERDWGDLP